MFSSNQILEISGEFEQLRQVLVFAIDYYQTQKKKTLYIRQQRMESIV